MRGRTCRRLLCLAIALSLSAATLSFAQRTNLGFQVNRYEPTAAGEWSLAVDHPWYSGTRYLAAGLTLNYAHDPLVLGIRAPDGTSTQSAALSHQLYMHLDVAGSFLDRILLTLSFPVALSEGGTRALGIAPLSTVTVGDPRIGAMVRVLGQPYSSPFSLSLGAQLWIPFGAGQPQVGDTSVRVLPKVVLAGLDRHILWSATAGFYYRPEQSIGTAPAAPGNLAGSEVQIGASVAYADAEHRFAAGPEVLFSTLVTGGNGFQQGATSLDLLLGVHHNIARVVQLSLGGGVGLLRQPGTPDGRFLLRLAYAPVRMKEVQKPRPVEDRDGDGVPDGSDACPDRAGVRSAIVAQNGCPPPPQDRDGDGVIDAEDECVDLPMGKNPDAAKRGCPNLDLDGDGVPDQKDACVDVPKGPHPDASRPGCPNLDRDGDGVLDTDDVCAEVVAGPHPDPTRRGCPDQDSDGDGVFDGEDLCKTLPQGLSPDPGRVGCPLSDRDRDLVPDVEDACPDKPGAPSTDKKKHGCPGLVEVRSGQIIILRQVYFANAKDRILKRSFPVLTAVAEVLKSTPGVRRVAIEGHTDDKGDPTKNKELSLARARSVLSWLLDHGIEGTRMEAQGFGPERPIAANKTEKGRAQNRRVEFRIVDPKEPERR